MSVRRRDRRIACAAAGSAALVVALAPPLADRADALLSTHMVQHLILQLVAAPLLVAAGPVTAALAALPRPTARRLARGMRHPAVRALGTPLAGVTAFLVVLAVVHVPAVHGAALRDPLAHDAMHAALFWSACWLWAPILRVDPLPHRPGLVGRVVPLLAAMVAMAALGSVLATASTVVYRGYLESTTATAAAADQAVAGGVMAIGGMLAMLPLLVVVAWRALAEEERRAQARSVRPASGKELP